MCGITGFAGTCNRLDWRKSHKIILSMTKALAHRGPDSQAVWTRPESAIALGHSRLAVQDLSEAGRQPMISETERYVMVFNGEIYNHLELRLELESGQPRGRKWRGHSDTETLLACFETWGTVSTLEKCVGMFAMALWDRKERKLMLARDRLGEKPLYYGWHNGILLFGSELKALKAHPLFEPEIDRDALTLLFRYNCIPAPYSIYKGIKKLLPGTYLLIDLAKPHNQPVTSLEPISYWSLYDTVEEGKTEPFTGNEQEAVCQLEKVLGSAVEGQMLADVPLGAFLSGGIDSSLIVALMQKCSSRPVRTFTIGFNEELYDEAAHARAVAKHIGTDHTELFVSARDAMDIIPLLPEIYDEPFSDSSQIPTFLVARMTREHVTVSLSGDGGDELFGGYNRHFLAGKVRGKTARLPSPFRKLLASAIRFPSPQGWNRLFQALNPFLPGAFQLKMPGDRLYKLANIIETDSAWDMYRMLVSHWQDPATIVKVGSEPLQPLSLRSTLPDLKDFSEIMMFADTLTYLPDDILVKVDRAAMAVSLETRLPFLDHRVVKFAWSLPISLKIRHAKGKWLLRELLGKFVPPRLFERPKMGFAIPLDSWLRGPLREWAEGLLDEKRLEREGYLNAKPVREKWAEHLSGKGNWQYLLWDILMFQAWLEQDR